MTNTDQSTFDPLLSNSPCSKARYPDSYWQSTVQHSVQHPTLLSDAQTDVLVIGAGFAGMSCAYHLKKCFNLDPIVIEANDVAWGASGRNAGFVLPLSGRLGYSELVDKFGLETTRFMHNEFLAGVSLVENIAEQSTLGIDRQPNGYIKIAHRPKYYDQLRRQADYLAKTFSYQVASIDIKDFRENYVDHKDAFGALRYEYGFGINPFKLALTYQQLLSEQQIQVFINTPALSITQHPNRSFVVNTPKGSITAEKIVIATNGYSTQGLSTALDNRLLPVQTSILVTRILTEEELVTSGFKTNQVMMDTRTLKYYYRLLPDNRILFGGRGAISGAQATNPIYHQRLLNALKQSFPSLKNVTMDYQWQGWISVSLDNIPHIYGDKESGIYYAAGYCGAGVSFSGLAGKRMAEKIAGKDTEHSHSPILTTPLPKFPFSRFRRVGQWGYYQFGRFKDKYL